MRRSQLITVLCCGALVLLALCLSPMAGAAGAVDCEAQPTLLECPAYCASHPNELGCHQGQFCKYHEDQNMMCGGYCCRHPDDGNCGLFCMRFPTSLCCDGFCELNESNIGCPGYCDRHGQEDKLNCQLQRGQVPIGEDGTVNCDEHPTSPACPGACAPRPRDSECTSQCCSRRCAVLDQSLWEVCRDECRRNYCSPYWSLDGSTTAGDDSSSAWHDRTQCDPNEDGSNIPTVAGAQENAGPRNDPWPQYGGDADESDRAFGAHVSYVNDGSKLVIWDAIDAGCGILSSSGPACEVTIRYVDANGNARTRRQGAAKKTFTMGQSIRQGVMGKLCPAKATRYVAMFDEIPSDTYIEYIIGCEPFFQWDDWERLEQSHTRSPGHVPADPERETSFFVVSDLWPKIGGLLQTLDDMTFDWVQESIRANTLRDARENPRAPFDADFALMPGDISNADGCAFEYYNNIFPELAHIERSRPLYKVWGNHDYHCDDGYNLDKVNFGPVHPQSYDDIEVSPMGDNRSKSYYHFSYGRLHFYALNIPSEREPIDNREGLLNSGHVRAGDPQYQWLEQELKNAPADAVKIVFFHAGFEGCRKNGPPAICKIAQEFEAFGDQECVMLSASIDKRKEFCQAVARYDAWDGGGSNDEGRCLASTIDEFCRIYNGKYSVANENCEHSSRWDLCRLLQDEQADLVFNGHWEMGDPHVVSYRYDESKPAVTAFLLPSGGVCRLSAQSNPPDGLGYGPRCSRDIAKNFLGYYIVDYKPEEQKLVISSVAVNRERQQGSRPVYSHSWEYRLGDEAHPRALVQQY